MCRIIRSLLPSPCICVTSDDVIGLSGSIVRRTLRHKGRSGCYFGSVAAPGICMKQVI